MSLAAAVRWSLRGDGATSHLPHHTQSFFQDPWPARPMDIPPQGFDGIPIRSHQCRLAPALTSRLLPRSMCSRPAANGVCWRVRLACSAPSRRQATSASARAPGTTSLTASPARPRQSRKAHALPGGVDRSGGRSRPGRALPLPARRTQGQGTPEVIPKDPSASPCGSMCATAASSICQALPWHPVLGWAITCTL